MRYDISLPQFVAPTGVDREAFTGYLRRAESVGFTGAWVMEQTLGPSPVLSPLETLAYAAACSDHIRLGVGVLVTSLHSPLHLANSIATVDLLSNGRTDIGVSAGGGFRDFAAFGVDRASFVARFVDGLSLMIEAWSDGPVDHEGRFFTVRGAVEPKPVQRPHPPLWFGAAARTSLRRAVRYGDAFLGAGSITTARFADQVGILHQLLAEAGRDPATYPIGKRVYLAVDDDGDTARARVLGELHGMYGDQVPELDQVAVAGTPQEVVAGLRAAIDAGAGMLVLNPLVDPADQLERLATEVLPALPLATGAAQVGEETR